MGCVQNKQQLKTSPLAMVLKFQLKNVLVFKQFIKKLIFKFKIYRPETLEEPTVYNLTVLEEELRNIIMGLIKDKLMQTNQGKISIKQCKVQIAKEILQVVIFALKFVQTTQPHKMKDFFDRISEFLITLSRFMKTIYPRGQNIQAGQLAKKFKEFDATQQFQYDMLKNAGFVFNSPNILDITKTIKLFLNRIMDQLQKHYPTFHQMISQIDGSFKIGRKISQNTAKYAQLDTGVIQIKSTQIARVLIKWMQQLTEIMKNPKQKISPKNEYKLYRLESKQSQIIQFAKCQPQTLEQLINSDLGFAFQNYKTSFNHQLKLRKSKFNQFTIHLIKILTEVTHSQTQLSRQAMQIIKYSYFNNSFVSWMVQQQLLLAISNLVSIARDTELSMGVLDLVKFKINDLMRCQIFGSRSKLLYVYQKFKNLENEGKIQIIKIKNRFATPMSDAMIFFKLPESFMICQCQLILADDTHGKQDKKAKNTQTLNHFLYELQRSPFGVIGQITVFLAAKYQSVSAYCDKIKLNIKDVQKVQKCLKTHWIPSNDPKAQLMPFICQKCVNYSPKYSNLMKTHKCKICDLKFCNNCTNSKMNLSDEFVQGHLNQKIKIYIDEFKQTKKFKQNPNSYYADINDLTAQYLFQNLFDQKSMKSIFKIKNNKLKAEEIINYITSNENYRKFYIEKDLKVNFIIITWRGEYLKFKCFQYDHQRQLIINTYYEIEKYQKYQSMEVNQFDLFYQFNGGQVVSFNQKSANYQKNKIGFQYRGRQILENGIYIFQGQSKQKMIKKFESVQQNQKDKYLLICYEINDSFSFIISFDHSVKRSQKKGKMKEYLSQIDDLAQFRKNIHLKNMNIDNQQISTLSSFSWTKFIKFMNLSSNKIADASIVFDSCPKLQKINLNNNKFQQLNFKKPYLSIKQISAQYNSIKKIVNFQNISKIQILDLKSNFLVNILEPKTTKTLKLQNIRALNLADNKLESIDQMKLIECPNLSYLNFSDNLIKKISSLKMLQLEEINLNNNKISTIDDFVQGEYPNLTEFYIKNNRLTIIPKLTFVNIRKFDVSFNHLKSLNDVNKNYFVNLTHLIISEIRLADLPKLGRDLRSFGYENSSLTDAQLDKFIKNVSLEQLRQLFLTRNNLTKLPNIQNLPQLKNLYIEQNPITNFDIIFKNTGKVQKIVSKNNENDSDDDEQENHNQQQDKTYTSLQKLWLSISFSFQKEFYAIQRNIRTTLANTKVVCWRYHSSGAKDSKPEQISESLLPRRVFLLAVFQNEDKINQKYFNLEDSKFYCLDHQFVTMDMDDFVKYDWRVLQQLQMRSCEIDDKKWKILVQNGHLFPQLKSINLPQNFITHVQGVQLLKFKQLQHIQFKSQQDGAKNPLSKQSIESLKKFKTTHTGITVNFMD